MDDNKKTLSSVGTRQKTLREIAQDELIEEKTKGFVKQLKQKLTEKQNAQIILANVEREIVELEAKIDQEINDVRNA